MKTDRYYDLWDLPWEEQEKLLGQDIGISKPMIVVELDPYSQFHFYNQRFTMLSFWTQKHQTTGKDEFWVYLPSIDDASLRMIWQVSQMCVATYTAIEMIQGWLKRTNHFVNLKGFEDMCRVFNDPYDVDHN